MPEQWADAEIMRRGRLVHIVGCVRLLAELGPPEPDVVENLKKLLQLGDDVVPQPAKRYLAAFLAAYLNSAEREELVTAGLLKPPENPRIGEVEGPKGSFS